MPHEKAPDALQYSNPYLRVRLSLLFHPLEMPVGGSLDSKHGYSHVHEKPSVLVDDDGCSANYLHDDMEEPTCLSP